MKRFIIFISVAMLLLSAGLNFAFLTNCRKLPSTFKKPYFQEIQKGKSKKVIPKFYDKKIDPWLGKEIIPKKRSDAKKIQKGKSKKVIPRFYDKKKDPGSEKEITPRKELKPALKRRDRISPTNTVFKTRDTTPPTPPSNVIADNESMHIVLCSWDESEDPESGIENYVFGVGTQPGEADIKWWQVTSRRKAYFYPLEYGLIAGRTVYISVYAKNGVDLRSDPVSSNPVTLNYEELGNPNNEIQVDYLDYGFDADGNVIDGWSQEEIERFEHFTSRMLPILKETYGPPARNYTVTFVKNLEKSDSATFFGQYNEIHMNDEWYPQLLTHELVHAFRDNVGITSNHYWAYDDALSGFEEGFAQAVSYECMNRYIENFPNDPYINTNQVWLSDYDWDYDFQNINELRTTDFWSDTGGMNLHWLRYEMAAAAMRKIQIENKNFYKQFNEAWYNRLNADPPLRSSRKLVVDVISNLVPEIEGIHAAAWIGQQYVFDCRVHPGKKVWVRTQHYPYWQYYKINQWIFYYETLSNGSDWAHWDGEQWVLTHNLNGSSGEAVLHDFNNNIIWHKELLIEPVENPPDWMGFGHDRKNLINIDNMSPPDENIGDLHELSLYKMDITFDEANKSIYRIVGDELVNFRGVWGGISGIIGGRGGKIYIDHEDFPEEEAMEVVNGVFYGERSWTGQPSRSDGYYDTIPGKLSIRYFDQNNILYSKKINIDRGGWYGDHIFLLDFRGIEEWSKKEFAGLGRNKGHSVQKTKDGGFIIVGSTSSLRQRDDVFLIKTDSNGNMEWSRTFGRRIPKDIGYSVQQTQDGGFIIVGSTTLSGLRSDVLLIKTDPDGNKMWSKIYGGGNADIGYSVLQTIDGGYVIAGITSSFGRGSDIYLIKTDGNGNEVWSNTYGGADMEFGYSMQQTEDGGYIIVGSTKNIFRSSSENIYLIKTNSDGNEIWSKIFGGTDKDVGYSVQQTEDGGYIITGSTRSLGRGDDVFLIKTKSNGDEKWSKTYGGTYQDIGHSVQKTQDDGYVIAGSTMSFGAGNKDVFLLKTDLNGNELWKRAYGGTDRDTGSSVLQTRDGGYIIVGSTKSFGAGDSDIYLIKIKPEPNTL